MPTRSITCICFLGCLWTACNGPSATDYYEQAVAQEALGNYEAAIQLLDLALGKDPDMVPAYINRGADYADLGEYEKAIENYEAVLERDPNNVLALFNLGNNNKRLLRYGQAVANYTQVISIKDEINYQVQIAMEPESERSSFDVTYQEVYYERGLAYFDMEDLKHAIQDFKKCLADDYLPRENHYLLGVSYLAVGLATLGREHLQQAAALGDEDAADLLHQYFEKVDSVAGF